MQDDIEAQVQAEEEEAASSGEDPEAQARHQEQLRKAQMEEERSVNIHYLHRLSFPSWLSGSNLLICLESGSSPSK